MIQLAEKELNNVYKWSNSSGIINPTSKVLSKTRFVARFRNVVFIG
jgi:hypothetical protein